MCPSEAERVFAHYRSCVGALPEGNIHGKVTELLCNDREFVRLYKDIYGNMAMAYIMSDREGQSFARQFRLLRRAVPQAFASRAAPRESLRGLPARWLRGPGRRAVYAFLPADRGDLLLRAMALSANIAAHWYGECGA